MPETSGGPAAPFANPIDSLMLSENIWRAPQLFDSSHLAGPRYLAFTLLGKHFEKHFEKYQRS